MQDVISLILGGGRGESLYPLTKHRSQPAVPFAGKYRLIDIPLSNCINSGLNRLYVVTQFLSVSLHRHIANTYKFDPFNSGFVEILAAQQTNETADWYRGTADAIRQNLRYLQSDQAAHVVILSADQLYRMDLRELVQTHRAGRAAVTMAVLPVHRHQAARLGIVRLDEQNRVVEMIEKPRDAEQLDSLRAPSAWLQRRGLAGRGQDYLANMGIYVFERQVLFDLLAAQPDATDLVTEILGSSLRTHAIQAYLFHGYWEDVGSIKSYHEANLALASPTPPFDFHSPEGIIYTRMRYLPASHVDGAHVEQCLISDGCILGAGRASNAASSASARASDGMSRCATPWSTAPIASNWNAIVFAIANGASPILASAITRSSNAPFSTRIAASVPTCKSSIAVISSTTKATITSSAMVSSSSLTGRSSPTARSSERADVTSL